MRRWREAPANGDGQLYCMNVIEWMYVCYKIYEKIIKRVATCHQPFRDPLWTGSGSTLSDKIGSKTAPRTCYGLIGPKNYRSAHQEEIRVPSTTNCDKQKISSDFVMFWWKEKDYRLFQDKLVSKWSGSCEGWIFYAANSPRLGRIRICNLAWDRSKLRRKRCNYTGRKMWKGMSWKSFDQIPPPPPPPPKFSPLKRDFKTPQGI